MIKNIVFDIGDVLAGFVWEKFYEQFLFPEDVYQAIVDATVKNTFWKEMDLGNLSEEELVNGFVANAPSLEKEIRLLFHDLTGIIEKYDYAIDWVREWKNKGYGVYFISNFSKKIFEDCNSALGFLDVMDGGIFSYRVKMIKPSTEIYQLLFDNYDLHPEECIFIDDTYVNIEAAQKTGMKTIHFQTKQQAENELLKLVRL